MDAIVTAGGIPLPEDPLYTESRGDSKALIPIRGKPMIQWVLDALGKSKHVENVIVIGLTEKAGLACKKPLHYLPNHGRMLANIVAGINKSLELNPKQEYALIVSSDIPAITAKQVDWLAGQVLAEPADIYYGFVRREAMEERFPGSKRTYLKLKDAEVCGADMNAVHVSMAREHLETWEALIGHRKNPLRQALVMGLDTLFAILFRQMTIEGLVARASERIGIRGKAIAWESAEPGMDVDKPHQLEILREDLGG